jgi:hypothetical protein
MCKEMLVILVNKVVDPKRIIGKREGQGGGEAQGVADPKKKDYLRFESRQGWKKSVKRCSLLR